MIRFALATNRQVDEVKGWDDATWLTANEEWEDLIRRGR